MWFEPIKLTEEQELNYLAYKNEWNIRKRMNRDEWVDWSISSPNGDPWDRANWLTRPSLHNFNHE